MFCNHVQMEMRGASLFDKNDFLFVRTVLKCVSTLCNEATFIASLSLRSQYTTAGFVEYRRSFAYSGFAQIVRFACK